MATTPSPPPLTIIITTSPTPSAPSTELLSALVSSFRTYCPFLLSCPIIVVFDTFERISEKPRLKKGVVTQRGAEDYEVYKGRVEGLILGSFCGRTATDTDTDTAADADMGTENGKDTTSRNMEWEECTGEAEFGMVAEKRQNHSVKLRIRKTVRVGQQQQKQHVTFIEPQGARLGFGLAVRSALRLAETPYVWVHQHDWVLSREIPIVGILDVMRRSGGYDPQGGEAAGESVEGTEGKEDVPVRYVCLPGRRMLGYDSSMDVEMFPSLRELTASLKRDFETLGGGRVPLTPLFFWHDKPHIVETKHYLERVFPTRLAVSRGMFIEDSVGQRARNQMKMGDWAKWALWLYCPGEGREECVRHLHGRVWRGVEGTRDKTAERKLEGEGRKRVKETMEVEDDEDSDFDAGRLSHSWAEWEEAVL